MCPQEGDPAFHVITNIPWVTSCFHVQENFPRDLVTQTQHRTLSPSWSPSCCPSPRMTASPSSGLGLKQPPGSARVEKLRARHWHPKYPNLGLCMSLQPVQGWPLAWRALSGCSDVDWELQAALAPVCSLSATFQCFTYGKFLYLLFTKHLLIYLLM